MHFDLEMLSYLAWDMILVQPARHQWRCHPMPRYHGHPQSRSDSGVRPIDPPGQNATRYQMDLCYVHIFKKESRDNHNNRPANLWESKTVLCDPKNCIFPPKTVSYNKMPIFWGEKKYVCARSAQHEREVLAAGIQGRKGSGCTRVSNALWCNLSLIF